MKSPISISVHWFFNASSLHTREQAERLFASVMDSLQTLDPIWVDFSDIEFVSRSFADELVQLKMSSSKKGLINFCCMSPDIRVMLQVVEHTQTDNAKEKKLPIQRFENLDSLMNFFSRV